MLLVLLLSGSETWRCSRGCSVGASKDCQTNYISWPLTQNYRINTFYMIHQIAAFFQCHLILISIRCKEASPASLARGGWPCSVGTSGRSSILKGWRHPTPRVSEFALVRPGEFNSMKTLNYVICQCRHQKEFCCGVSFLVLRICGHW